jgi:hypothetical protein
MLVGRGSIGVPSLRRARDHRPPCPQPAVRTPDHSCSRTRRWSAERTAVHAPARPALACPAERRHVAPRDHVPSSRFGPEPPLPSGDIVLERPLPGQLGTRGEHLIDRGREGGADGVVHGGPVRLRGHLHDRTTGCGGLDADAIGDEGVMSDEPFEPVGIDIGPQHTSGTRAFRGGYKEYCAPLPATARPSTASTAAPQRPPARAPSLGPVHRRSAAATARTRPPRKPPQRPRDPSRVARRASCPLATSRMIRWRRTHPRRQTEQSSETVDPHTVCCSSGSRQRADECAQLAHHDDGQHEPSCASRQRFVGDSPRSRLTKHRRSGSGVKHSFGSSWVTTPGAHHCHPT